MFFPAVSALQVCLACTFMYLQTKLTEASVTADTEHLLLLLGTERRTPEHTPKRVLVPAVYGTVSLGSFGFRRLCSGSIGGEGSRGSLIRRLDHNWGLRQWVGGRGAAGRKTSIITLVLREAGCAPEEEHVSLKRFFGAGGAPGRKSLIIE